MQIWFIGGGSFAASCLLNMSKEIHFDKIITGCPTKAGRGLKEQPSAVERAAVDAGLAVERTEKLSANEELQQLLVTDPPDLVFVIDFAQLIREPLLSAPRFGCLNIHPSLLPKWRGSAPIQRSLMAGDSLTGVTVFRLAPAMDAGPVLAQAEYEIGPEDDADTLMNKLAFRGSKIALNGIKSLCTGTYHFSEQDGSLATYAAKISKDEASLAWTMNCREIHNTVRALRSSGGAYVTAGGRRLKLWKTLPLDAAGTPGEIVYFMDGDPVVACGAGALRLCEVQSEGKRRVSASEWARGIRLQVGVVLT